EKRQVPVFRMMEIGEATFGERANEVQRDRRVRVPLEEKLRIGPSRVFREARSIDEIPAIAGERRLFLRLHGRRSRLRVLPCKSPDAKDGSSPTLNEHERHLKKDLQHARDHVGLTSRERLRAISALKDESPARLRVSDVTLQALGLPARNE